MAERAKRIIVIAAIAAAVAGLALFSVLRFDQTPEAAVETAAMSSPFEGEEALRFEGYRKLAENERFELYVDGGTGNVQIVGKPSGTVWTGTPTADGAYTSNNASFVASPLHIRYTEGVGVTQTYTHGKEDAELTIKSADGTVRAEFALHKLKLSLAVDYRLTEEGLEVTIPYSSLKEEGDIKVVSVEVLPFFNAAANTDDGALFIPDGSGALISYKEQHPAYFTGYSEYVYGPDYSIASQVYSEVEQETRRSFSPRQLAALPVFGNYRNGTGFLGIVTKGEFDAKINGVPSGIRAIELYRTATEFIYRKEDVIFVGSSGKIPFFQKEAITGDRAVHYVLLEGEEAHYVGMAKAYRQYLTRSKGIQPVEDGLASLQLRLLGGLLRDEVIGSTFVPMTTFEQARRMIEAYLEAGIDKVEVTLDGWSKDGLYGEQPNHFPAASKLGGTRSLKELAEFARGNGIALYVGANYVRPYADGGEFNKSRDVIRGLNKDVVANPNTHLSNGYENRNELFYLLKPKRAYESYLLKELDHFADLGAAGLWLKHVGDRLYSDQDPKSPSSREQNAQVWQNALQAVRDNVGKAAVDYGFAYTLGYVDRIDDAPLDSSSFLFADETVPFYQIAIRGLVPYTAAPSNLRDDARRQWLRMIEYGALPSYELTHEDTGKLQRTMEDRLFSSSYADWLSPSIEEYRQLADLYEQIRGQAIVGHRQLARGVYKTSYANDVEVIVNYTDEEAVGEGWRVPAEQYVVAGRGME